MSRQIEIFIDKLYRYDRTNEHCFIGFPLPKGLVSDSDQFSMIDPEKKLLLPTQIKATSRYEDGSIRFIFIRFMADIPANKKCKYICEISTDNDACDNVAPNFGTDTKISSSDLKKASFTPVTIKDIENGYESSTIDDASGEVFSYKLKNNSAEIFDSISAGKKAYEGKALIGPVLKKAESETEFSIKTGTWQVVENGPLCSILKTTGSHMGDASGEKISFALKLTAWAGKPYTEISYRIINDTDNPLNIGSLKYLIKRDAADGNNEALSSNANCNSEGIDASELLAKASAHLDSTGCGDSLTGLDFGEGPLYHVSKSQDADRLVSETDLGNVRTIAASSNY